MEYNTVSSDHPTVSIIIPCYNERDHIELCVRSILAQEPPAGGFEVIVADGMSDDGTRDILGKLAKEDKRLRVVDNPNCFTPFAMNVGIREARGGFITIMGAHTEYANDYIRTCLDLLVEHPEVWCSGGPIISRGKTRFGRAVAVAMSHPIGVGNAKHRFSNYEGYAEGACFPMFRREVFDRIGYYDESLVRNQDDEFNLRMSLNGGKVFISPRVRCIYYVREQPIHLFWQYFNYGYHRVAVLKKHRIPASLRQIAPVVFFPTSAFLLTGSLILPGWWALAACGLPLAYVLTLCSGGAWVALKEGITTGLLFPVAAFIMHFSYAIGFIRGLMGSEHPEANNMWLEKDRTHA